MLGRLGWPEILVIVVLLIVLFGSSKIPSMMKNLAGGIKTFKKEMKNDETDSGAAETKSSGRVKSKQVTTKRAPTKKTAPIRKIVKKK